MLSEYEKKSREFLDRTGVKMETLFTGIKPYFLEDKESRENWRIALTRKETGIDFGYGGSIDDLKANREIIRNGQKRKAPGAYAVLASLSGDIGCPDSFDDFCAGFGYDPDSRKAGEVFNRVKELSEKVRGFFTTEELEELATIN
jgi:hypothetical protein